MSRSSRTKTLSIFQEYAAYGASLKKDWPEISQTDLFDHYREKTNDVTVRSKAERKLERLEDFTETLKRELEMLKYLDEKERVILEPQMNYIIEFLESIQCEK